MFATSQDVRHSLRARWSSLLPPLKTVIALLHGLH